MMPLPDQGALYPEDGLDTHAELDLELDVGLRLGTGMDTGLGRQTEGLRLKVELQRKTVELVRWWQLMSLTPSD